MEQIMSWGGFGTIQAADILVLKQHRTDEELARFIVLSANPQQRRWGNGQELVYTLYTIGTHPFNTPLNGVDDKVGTIFTLSRKQMINDYTEVWSKLC